LHPALAASTWVLLDVTAIAHASVPLLALAAAGAAAASALESATNFQIDRVVATKDAENPTPGA